MGATENVLRNLRNLKTKDQNVGLFDQNVVLVDLNLVGQDLKTNRQKVGPDAIPRF